MKARASLGIILIAMLLTHSLHGFKWQAMGSGMNNTVISEIWNGIENTLQTAMSQDDFSAKNIVVNDISDRLNTRWDQAWNAVITYGTATYDTILYGYAFRNQWMWYNGVPFPGQNQMYIVTLLVWKDYNCQTWYNIRRGETSSFTTAQKAAIRAEIDKMTEAGIDNDIWGTAFTMMKNLEAQADFSAGGYSVIMSQNGIVGINGRICRVSNGFYHSYQELNFNAIISSANKGTFYLFQTRSPP